MAKKKKSKPRKKFIALNTDDDEFEIGSRHGVTNQVSEWLAKGTDVCFIEVYELGAKIPFEQKVTLNISREKKAPTPGPSAINSPFGDE